MKKFTNWLNDTRGQATALQHAIGVNATSISNVKHSRRPIPCSWMEVVIGMTNGTKYAISLSELHKWRLSVTDAVARAKSKKA